MLVCSVVLSGCYHLLGKRRDKLGVMSCRTALMSRLYAMLCMLMECQLAVHAALGLAAPVES